jgi:C4-dicarboxylate-specific signal transduction histidine kinase
MPALMPDRPRPIYVEAYRQTCGADEEEIISALIDPASGTARQANETAQAELAHAGRVAMLGEMNASIAHEISQPLAAILANAHAGARWLQRETPDIDHALLTIRQIIDAAQHATRIIQQMRALANKAEPQMSVLDLNGMVDDALTLVRCEALYHRIELRCELASGLPPVRGSATLLRQVVTNLVLNGLQATAAAGNRTTVVIQTSRYGADHLLLAVEDDGAGVEAEKLNCLFRPFYTTKPHGMGMGLSICRSIVDAHGGELRAARNTGSGMTFEFILPVAQDVTAQDVK